MNEYDSDHLARSLIINGYIPVDNPANADIILINTCAVRAKPEQKAASFLGRMIGIKKKNPHTILGVAGCMAQQEGIEFIKRFPQVDLVMGPREIDRFQDYLQRIQTNQEKVVATDLSFLPPKPIHCEGYFKGRVTGFVSIMEGCNNFCTYCIVPFVRGREISRSPDDIITEVKDLLADGIKEITLLGQNVISYNWQNQKFDSILLEISKIEGLMRLRFTTSHPKDLSDDIISCFKDINKLCPHLHLPFQAGSNNVLKRMKRSYTRENYLNIIAKLRETRQDIAITSDVMVGFPGESEDDFELTLDLIRQVQFDNLFSFKYSDRKGTLAFKMDDKIPEEVKSRRLKILQDLQKEITLRRNRELKGMQIEVLVEGQSKKGDQFSGRSGTNKIVNFTHNNCEIGDIVNVRITKCFFNSLQA
jgi:tRNA-2-methylthio-N6-dimethylallyladenosine synthase